MPKPSPNSPYAGRWVARVRQRIIAHGGTPEQALHAVKNTRHKEKTEIIYMPLPLDDPMKRKPDISLAKEKLNGWEPKIHLKEGLQKTIAYFEEILKIN
mgnify:CR=1 FL=1